MVSEAGKIPADRHRHGTSMVSHMTIPALTVACNCWMMRWVILDMLDKLDKDSTIDTMT